MGVVGVLLWVVAELDLTKRPGRMPVASPAAWQQLATEAPHFDGDPQGEGAGGRSILAATTDGRAIA